MKIRVVTDKYAGFEAQFRFRFWPFWFEFHKPGKVTNTFRTEKEAREFAIERAATPRWTSKVVWKGESK